MKKFTKIALIVALAFVILGSIFCAVGMGIGFHFSDFRNAVEAGEFSIGPLQHIPFIRYENDDMEWEDGKMNWSSEETENFRFAGDSVKNLDMDVDYAGVVIEEGSDSSDICVDVEYRRKSHKRKVEVSMSGDTLKIKDGKVKRIRNSDSVRITIKIPEKLLESQWLNEVDIEQGAGYAHLNVPLTAKEISINVDAGECMVSKKLTAEKSMSLEVDAGRIELADLETEKLKMHTGVGQLTVSMMQAEKIEMECGIGAITATAAGRESDYSYEIECSVGSTAVGGSIYNGLGSERKIKNPGNKKMEIECGVGNVNISFSQLGDSN